MPGAGEMGPFRFAVAFSYAGAHRDKVRAIAERVSAAIDPGLTDRSQGHVFFDEWFEHEIAGPAMRALLKRIYGDQSLMVVADLSEEYNDSPWCQAEGEAIRSLRQKLNTETDETARLRLLEIRLGEGDTSKLFNPDWPIDGIKKTPAECADLILKRHALLVARMAVEAEHRSPTRRADEPAQAPATEDQVVPTPQSAAPPPPARSWVWHATLATRAAGQVSVLACVETLLAVVLYWWIVWRYDTHLHLVTSVFIAPLLLLRSPESIKAGVEWFMNDRFGFTYFDKWPEQIKVLRILEIALAATVPTYYFAQWLSQCWLPGLRDWALFGWSAVVGVLSFTFVFAGVFAGSLAFAGAFASKGENTGAGENAVVVAFEVMRVGEGFFVFAGPIAIAIAVAGSGAVAGAEAVKGTVAGAFAGAAMLAFALMLVIADAKAHAVAVVFAVAIFGAIAGALVGAGASVGVVFGLAVGVGAAEVFGVVVVLRTLLFLLFGPGVAAGLSLRSLVFRWAATARFFISGLSRLPENWRENNFLTDFRVPAELMPGITGKVPSLAMDGFVNRFLMERDRSKRTFYLIAGPVYFIPVLFYRINIKATAWFWWPLAYLLKPVPALDEAGRQKQELCAPWTNPFQRLMLGVSVVLTGASLVLSHLDLSTFFALRHLQTLPLAVKVTLAVDWAHYAPWHWMQWVITGTGAAMFWLAGHAVSNARNDNWADFYRHNARWAVPLMTGLKRVRTLATAALLVMALGALLLQYRVSWEQYVSVPEAWFQALEHFYRTTR